MFNRYFQQELSFLKDLSTEYSKRHPSLAPMLSGPSADPDVERLLEGVAFLTGLLRQKLDDEFPEIIHDLMRLIWPHYLRPVPSTTMIACTPKQTLKQSTLIPAGVSVASVPVEGTSCLFRTSHAIEIHPLTLQDAAFEQPSGKPPAIKLLMELNGIKVSGWQPGSLRLFLAGDYANASDLYFLFRHHLKHIIITPLEKGSAAVLPPECLRPVGFTHDEALIPYPSHAFPGYRIIQEYFIAPEKFLFLDLVGWERWSNRGEGSRFEIVFELQDLPFSPPRVRKENFILFVAPAINIFQHEADPIMLDHRKTHYSIRPSGMNPEHHQVFSVDRVIGYLQGTAEQKTYVPFECFSPDAKSSSVYHLTYRESPIRPGSDVLLSVAYPPEVDTPVSETLSVHLTCTNGSLPESLRIGDISIPTSSSPEFAEFRNITPPTVNMLPPLGSNLLWRFLSHLSLNYLSLAKGENLRALLDLYVFLESRNRVQIVANKKRINGILHIETKPSNRLVSGVMMRGQDITLKLQMDHFTSVGDMFLFGCILDHFLGGYASINNFTRLIVQESLRGDIYQWPARLGDRPLI